ncbi:MAG: methionine adenosyltransferase [Planctomycetota bacterium]
MSRHLFTSESVTMGHPDKIADQISDAILDAIMARDPYGRVACETLVTTGLAIIAGEITTDCYVDMPQVVRDTIREIGYTNASMGFDCDTCAVLTSIDKQSEDISQGVTEGEGLYTEQGAGDQGMMFGYACTETPELMPMPIHLAHRICEQLARFRQDRVVKWLRPDGKSQVTIEYHDNVPRRIHTIVVAAQHTPEVSYDTIRRTIIDEILPQAVPTELLDDDTIYHINPTGRFVTGGPQGDCGVTGRKIIVDTYGGRGAHGGGAFSGKDPTKVDRSASYMARHVAKNIVAAGIATECEVQLSYAIGVARPISVLVNTFGTGKADDERLVDVVTDLFDLRPKQIIDYLKLRRPIFKRTARHGHFGREEESFTWERTHRADDLKEAIGIP